MTEKVNFDKNLIIALERAEKIIIKEFSSHENCRKYKNRFKSSIGEKNLKRSLKIILTINESEEYPFRYRLMFTDYYDKPVSIIVNSKCFNPKVIKKDFFDHIWFAFDYQNWESRP